MLCNNTQFYEWHPVYPMRGWTFAWLDGWDEAWKDFDADRREPQLTRLEKFVILVLIAFVTALVCRAIFWILVFLS